MTNHYLRKAIHMFGPKVAAWLKKNAPGYLRKFKERRAGRKAGRGGMPTSEVPVAGGGVGTGQQNGVPQGVNGVQQGGVPTPMQQNSVPVQQQQQQY
jgi:hypothetical protein